MWNVRIKDYWYTNIIYTQTKWKWKRWVICAIQSRKLKYKYFYSKEKSLFLEKEQFRWTQNSRSKGQFDFTFFSSGQIVICMKTKYFNLVDFIEKQIYVKHFQFKYYLCGYSLAIF